MSVLKFSVKKKHVAFEQILSKFILVINVLYIDRHRKL